MGRIGVLLALLAAAAGCNDNQDIVLHYHLVGIAPADVVRVDTLIDVATSASDPRTFYADQPYREVATGVGYEVRDLDGSGQLTMRLSFDATLGYEFTSDFAFRLLPPVGEKAPALTLAARAFGTSDAISDSASADARFPGAVDLRLADARCSGGTSCASDQTCCPGAGCVRTDSDANHCGDCATSCGTRGDSCSGGACRCAGGSGCAAGQTCCAGLGCVDLATDPFHCGSCDKACNPGEACVAGTCMCGSHAACTGAGNMVCCGSGDSASCSAGGCPCGGTTCGITQVCCNDVCVDERVDNGNCGACARACTSPLSCAGGACSCNGLICTAGDSCCADGCANLSNDPAHCGSCDKKCDANETCGPAGGNSAPTCLCDGKSCNTGESCCGKSCVDTRSSFANCGACGHSCKQGEQCTSGVCTCNGGAACTGNQVCCLSGSTAGGGGCFDVSSGPQHCGSCSAPACGAGQTCQMGQCVGGGCGNCTNGNACLDGSCGCLGAPNNAACSGNLTCCPGIGCVDLSSDPKNCNACGKACADPLCCNGTCKPYSPADCGKCGTNCNTTQCCPPCLLNQGYTCANSCLCKSG